MSYKKFFAIFFGKTILFITQKLKVGGGSAAPGLYALRIYPDFIKDITSQIPQSVIITGTNGKTTTSKLLAHIASANGLKVLRNTTGSNLERGIASTLLKHLSFYNFFTKSVPFDLAIWEMDEAAFAKVLPNLNPTLIIILNIFRDQLDRYGEIDSLIKRWNQTLDNIDSAVPILINGDDESLLNKLQTHSHQVKQFGIAGEGVAGEKSMDPKKEKKLNFQALEITPKGLEGSNFSINFSHSKLNIFLPMAGTYNIYNFLAAFAASQNLNIPTEIAKNSLTNFLPPFGRVEKIKITPHNDAYILLIKNPTGTSEVIKLISKNLQNNDAILIALNDNLADGTDVSWIWDVNFELLPNSKIFVSGTRAFDLAVRLKYAGIADQQIIIESSLAQALHQATDNLTGTLFVLPTYTALLELQKNLANKGLKKHYWQEV